MLEYIGLHTHTHTIVQNFWASKIFWGEMNTFISHFFQKHYSSSIVYIKVIHYIIMLNTFLDFIYFLNSFFGNPHSLTWGEKAACT